MCVRVCVCVYVCRNVLTLLLHACCRRSGAGLHRVPARAGRHAAGPALVRPLLLHDLPPRSGQPGASASSPALVKQLSKD